MSETLKWRRRNDGRWVLEDSSDTSVDWEWRAMCVIYDHDHETFEITEVGANPLNPKVCTTPVLLRDKSIDDLPEAKRVAETLYRLAQSR